MVSLKRCIVKVIKFLNWFLSGLSIRLVKWTGKSPQYIHPKHLLNETPEWVRLFSADDIVLDVGCHNGQRDFRLSPFVKNIIAFDYDAKAIQNAKQWQHKNNIKNVDFRELSAESALPFESNSFDKVLFLDVIEHLNNRDLILKECFRVLKKGGRVVLAAPNKETPWKNFQKNLGLFYYSDTDHKIEYSEAELKGVINIAGFTIESISPVVYDFPLPGLIDFIGSLNLSIYKHLQRWKVGIAKEKPSQSIGFLVVAIKK
jgi:SAM-dependent methyltransferase